MDLLTNETDDPGYVSISGNVRGLFTVTEGFFRVSDKGQVWIAYLTNGKVHYFTNDTATTKQPPKIMAVWSSRFKNAEWKYHKISTDKLDNCK
jgi:hypothetical protein